MVKNRSLVLVVLCCLIMISKVNGQGRFGNEWIVPGQQYFKVNIGADGIYQLKRNDLLTDGFPAASIDPRRIQLFHRGVEQAIHIEGQGDGVFGSTDFLEFYGRRADGSTDTDLYTTPGNQPHTFYNLFSDSSAYFLTYRLDNTNGLRMEEFAENNVSGIPQEEYFLEEHLQLFTTSYNEGLSYGSTNETILSQYDAFEGWVGTFASAGSTLTATIENIDNTFETGIKPTLDIQLTGGNNNNHAIEILIGPTSTALRSMGIVNFSGDENFTFQSEIEWSDISPAGEIIINCAVRGVNGQADRAALAYVRLIYSKTFDLAGEDNKKILLKPNSTNKSFLQISNAAGSPLLLDITETSSPVRIGTGATGTNITAIIDETSTQRELFLQSQILTPSLASITFDVIDPSLYNYIIITNDSLRQETLSGNPDPVDQYRSYRESTVGGEYDVFVVSIDDIFNQFNYGESSPTAIRRFMDYMLDGGAPTHLFIIGRSTNNSFDFYRQTGASTTNFVPTYGHPGSDIPFTAGLAGSNIEPALATGRINVKTPGGILSYLNKVKEAESQPYDDLWHKNLIHLSGGRSESELITFKTYIDGFKSVAESPLLGGSAAQNSKNTNQAVEFFNISEEVNKGVSLITFFGHSSPSVTDIEVGLVSNPAFGYNNKGRYPVFLVNGCNAGDFFSPTESFGIDWLLTPDLGAIGFMAHSSIAFSNNLRRYSDIFYATAFTSEAFFGKTLGEIKKEVSRSFIEKFGNSQSNITQVQQFVLQGDPAVKVFSATEPDYDITENNLVVDTFDGSMLLTSTESFYVDIDVKNYGKFDATPLSVTLRRTLSNGSMINYPAIEYNPVLRQDTLRFIVDNEIEENQGNNTFQIILDEVNQVNELNESNNTATFDLFLATGSTFNLLPMDFGIVSSSAIDFTFQATDVLSGTREFLLEVDTVPGFNSTYLIKRATTANAAAIVTVDLAASGNIVDNTVFYWRTKFSNPAPTELDEWVQSSFTLASSSSKGWRQQSNTQLDMLNKEGLNINVGNGIWGFPSNNTSLQVTTYGPDHPDFNTSDTQVLLGGQNFFISASTIDPGCRTNTINIMAFDQQSTNPYTIVDLNSADVLDDRICGKIPQIIYNFTESEMSNTFNPEALIDNINQNDGALVFSLGSVNYSSWSASFKDRLVELGISRSTIDNLEDGEPLIFFGKKGAPEGTATEVLTSIAPKTVQAVSIDTNIEGSFFSGSLISDRIGPSLGYTNFSSDLDIGANNAEETYSFQILGVDQNNVETPLFSGVQDENIDLSSINATQFPYLRLQFQSFDDLDLTPTQLKSWEITFNEAPEGILLKRDTDGIANSIAVQEGAPQASAFTFWNFSENAFADSIKVRFDLLNTSTSTLFLDSMNIAPLAAGDSTNFSINITTLGKTGTNDLVMNVNNMEQTEIYTNNNALRISDFLEISPDETNPIMEVSFDGIFILDGDVVSPSPNVLVRLKDENQFLLKEDTLGVNLFLRRPCDGCDFERISFSSPEVTWTPATDAEDFRVDYTPSNLENGIYGFQVQATDQTGNESGALPYEINFEVINESTITNFYPYPNPFSTSTRFVFTLTGQEIPSDIKIQIMTITGRIVREILTEELGSINIGNNITDYAWNGKDEYGDQLANGVYLYRVIIKNNGNPIQQRGTSADKAFKNGFGKLYLLR